VRRPTPTKEQQLLFNLLKGVPPTTLEGIDTALLFDLFRRHRLFPLAPALIPMLEEKEQERWSRALRLGSVRTLRFTSMLHEVVEGLREEGIGAMPLKGPVLAQALYGDVGQRHMRDLDLLVTRGDLPEALQVLQRSGYLLKSPTRSLTPRQWRLYLRHQYDVALVHQQQGAILELHTRITYPGLLGGAEQLLTESREQIEISGTTVECMTREATFLYLVLHGAHHLFFRLFWLRDLAEALKRWELDHEQILDMARQMGMERMLGLGLRLAKAIFNAPVPDTYRALLDDHAPMLKRLEHRCRRAMLTPNYYGKWNRVNVLCFSMALRPGWMHRCRTLSSVWHRWIVRRLLVR
jgi:hypothetical protein